MMMRFYAKNKETTQRKMMEKEEDKELY